MYDGLKYLKHTIFMYSIFIWKANFSVTECPSKIHYYSGSDWFGEEIKEKEKKEKKEKEEIKYYDILHQKEWKSVYCIHAKSRNGVGTDLLSVQEVPYRVVRQTPYGTITQWGMWMRLKTTIPWDEIESRENEWMNVIYPV